MKRTTDEVKYWNPYVAGVLLGVLLFLSFFIIFTLKNQNHYIIE